MALAAALLGWLFDGAEMGVFSLVGRSAVQDMLGIVGQPTPVQEGEIGFLFGVIIAVFLVGAATGGVLFGWLGDRIGRVRAMSLSVLTYAIFTGLCGFAQTPEQLGALRFVASLGMGGEWALGVALVMEVWPNRSRALMAGLIGAAANCGYLLVGVIGIGLNSILAEFQVLLTDIGLSEATVNMLVANKGWRLMMISGTLPALLTFFFRIFVPESHKWEAEQGKGNTSNWATIDLLGVFVGALGPCLIVYVWASKSLPPESITAIRIGGTVVGLAIAVLGYTYPVFRYLQRTVADGRADAPTSPWPTIRKMLLGACISGVALLGTWGSTQWASTWAGQLTQADPVLSASHPREWTLISLSLGAIVGTIAAAMCGDWLGRRLTYCLMCVLSLAGVLIFYQTHNKYDSSFLFWAFILGTTTASFYGWLPLYLPELFATKVRATGQGFAFNFGRILAAIGGLQISALLRLPFFADTETWAKVKGGYPVGCSWISVVYILGLAIIWLAPETKGKPLPE
ncbi:MAG: MFS transporter [Planctomycetia bacterium]|nr:MFS transporter [Planctomycetia bacterium]